MINKTVLHKTPLLFSASDRDIEDFKKYIREERYKDQDIIFHEGDQASYLCIIAQGDIGIGTTDKKGEIKIMWELKTNMVFGELALLDGQPRSGTAVAVGDTVLYSLHLDEFIRMCDEVPGLALKISINMAKVLASNLRNTNVRFYRAVDALQAKSAH